MVVLSRLKYISTGYYIPCKHYEKCKLYMPKEYHLCSEIVQAWKATYKCIAAANCYDEYYGAGLIVGQCLAYYQIYTRIKKCGLSEKGYDFPSEKKLCGVEDIPKFSIEFSNKRTYSDCMLSYPTRSCDSQKMARFMPCIKKVSKNKFTEGVMKGGCDYFSVKGETCHFSKKICELDWWQTNRRNSANRVLCSPPFIIVTVLVYVLKLSVVY